MQQSVPCGRPPAESSVLPQTLSRWPEHHTGQRFLMGPCGTCIHKQITVKSDLKVKRLLLKISNLYLQLGSFFINSTKQKRNAKWSTLYGWRHRGTEQRENTSYASLLTQIKPCALKKKNLLAWGLNTWVFRHGDEQSDWPWRQDQRPPLQTAAPDWTQPASHSPLSLSHCKWTSGSEEEYIHRLHVGRTQGQWTVNITAWSAFIPVFPLLLCQLES